VESDRIALLARKWFWMATPRTKSFTGGNRKACSVVRVPGLRRPRNFRDSRPISATCFPIGNDFWD
jgi:hypothetical protein